MKNPKFQQIYLWGFSLVKTSSSSSQLSSSHVVVESATCHDPIVAAVLMSSFNGVSGTVVSCTTPPPPFGFSLPPQMLVSEVVDDDSQGFVLMRHLWRGELQYCCFCWIWLTLQFRSKLDDARTLSFCAWALSQMLDFRGGGGGGVALKLRSPLVFLQSSLFSQDYSNWDLHKLIHTNIYLGSKFFSLAGLASKASQVIMLALQINVNRLEVPSSCSYVNVVFRR